MAPSKQREVITAHNHYCTVLKFVCFVYFIISLALQLQSDISTRDYNHKTFYCMTIFSHLWDDAKLFKIFWLNYLRDSLTAVAYSQQRVWWKREWFLYELSFVFCYMVTMHIMPQTLSLRLTATEIRAITQIWSTDQKGNNSIRGCRQVCMTLLVSLLFTWRLSD